MKHITSASEFNSKPHLAALVFSTIHIPGDERSRTHPGHGYPASTEPVMQYKEFKDEAEMLAWVSEQENPKFGSPNKNYRIIEARPKETKITVSVA